MPGSQFGQEIKHNQEKRNVVLDTCNCNWNCWPDLGKSMYHFDKTQMFFFLFSIKDECKNNIEFSEVGNETLFYSLQANPEEFISVLENYHLIMDTSYILFNLENPVHDGINLNEIILKVKSVEGHDKTKLSVHQALTKAIKKM